MIYQVKVKPNAKKSQLAEQADGSWLAPHQIAPRRWKGECGVNRVDCEAIRREQGKREHQDRRFKPPETSGGGGRCRVNQIMRMIVRGLPIHSFEYGIDVRLSPLKPRATSRS